MSAVIATAAVSWPGQSRRRPPGPRDSGSSAATGSTKASCTHDSCAGEAPRACWIPGRVTATVTTGR
ncbi:hypothetical protein AB0K18_06605 [Nonomuraea sp. NPDC049421]|uniref:hypothetical protein n=1 Tax=Nonomuraea sp. NPDC049421 TaxID=3155275 RepID=UPI00341A08D9